MKELSQGTPRAQEGVGQRVRFRIQGLHNIARRIAFLAFVAALTVTFASANAATSSKSSDPVDQFKAAYALVKIADNFLEQSFLDDACEAYMDALEAYERIARKHPKWNADVVSFRIKYCQDRLEKIFLGQAASFRAKSSKQKGTGLQGTSDLLERMPEVKPGDFKQTMKVAAAREKDGDFAAARLFYEDAMLLEPSNDDAVRGAARCCLSMGLIARGQDHLHALVSKAPDNPENILLLAEFACVERDFTKALRILAPAMTVHPENARLRFMVGMANMGLSRLDRAEEELLKAVELEPGLGVAHYNLARLLVMREPADITAAHKHYLASVQAGGEKDANLERLFSAVEEGLRQKK